MTPGTALCGEFSLTLGLKTNAAKRATKKSHRLLQPHIHFALFFNIYRSVFHLRTFQETSLLCETWKQATAKITSFFEGVMQVKMRLHCMGIKSCTKSPLLMETCIFCLYYSLTVSVVVHIKTHTMAMQHGGLPIEYKSTQKSACTWTWPTRTFKNKYFPPLFHFCDYGFHSLFIKKKNI